VIVGLRTWLGLKKRPPHVEEIPDDIARPAFWSADSHAQLQQDRWVLHELGDKRNGFFVEIGAFDGKHLSNTYLLEKEYGWTGLLAEPNPLMAVSIRANRTAPLCEMPVGQVSGQEVAMLFVDKNPQISAMEQHAFNDMHADLRRRHKSVRQKTIGLNDLLESYSAPRQIDFVSIDTEGSEPEILAGFDFDRYCVQLFAIEHNYTPAQQVIDDLMKSKGYERVYEEWSRFDAWYRRVT